MSSKRTFLIVGSSLLALGAGGGAIAVAADPGSPVAASTATPGMSGGMPTSSMMKEMDAAGMGRMAAGMPMKLDARQLKQMTATHNKMVRGMMDGDSMMRDAGKKMGG